MASVSDLITQQANAAGVPASLALAVAQKESGLNQNAIGSSGELGVFQLMPATAKGLNVDPSNLSQNIQGGIAYLKQLFTKYGDWNTALVAYNEGPGNLANKGVFPVSQSYADSILAAAGLESSDLLIPGPVDASGDVFESLDLSATSVMSGGAWAALALVVVAGVVWGMNR